MRRPRDPPAGSPRARDIPWRYTGGPIADFQIFMFLGPGTRADQRDPRGRSTPRRPPRRGVPQSGVLGRPGPIPVGTRRADAPVSMSRPVSRRRGRDPTAVLIPAGGLPLRAGELGTDPYRRYHEEAATLPPSRGRTAACGRGFWACTWASRSEDADSLGPGHAAPSGHSRRSGTWRSQIEAGEVARGCPPTASNTPMPRLDHEAKRPTVFSIDRCWFCVGGRPSGPQTIIHLDSHSHMRPTDAEKAPWRRKWA